jgi:hypothetical protein
VLDPLHVIKIYGQRPDPNSVRSPASRGENVVDPVNGTGLEAPQAEGAPDEIDDLANPDILENVGWLHGCGNADEKLVIGGGILALDERRRTSFSEADYLMWRPPHPTVAFVSSICGVVAVKPPLEG